MIIAKIVYKTTVLFLTDGNCLDRIAYKSAYLVHTGVETKDENGIYTFF